MALTKYLKNKMPFVKVNLANAKNEIQLKLEAIYEDNSNQWELIQEAHTK